MNYIEEFSADYLDMLSDDFIEYWNIQKQRYLI